MNKYYVEDKNGKLENFSHSSKMDVYDFPLATIILTETPEEGIILFSDKKYEDQLRGMKSMLEKVTTLDLEEIKNGN